ncbi:MAG: MFS transporter [Hyphomonadaceae bacterium]|nr:MFS transporter [Hyphomonadaceae bacterium]
MTAASDTSARKHGGALLALFLVVFVSMTGFGVLVPITPFFGLHMGADAGQITIAMGAYSLGQLVAAPLWGRVSDRYGRRPVLIVTLVLTGVSYLVLARVETIFAFGFVRFAAGLAAGNVSAAFAAATDISSPETRARAMGVVGAGFGLGFIVGPAIGGLIAGQAPDATDFARVCFVACALAGIAALVAFFLLQETRPDDLPLRKPGQFRALFSRAVLVQLVGATLLGVTAQAMLETSFGLWADEKLGWGPPEIGVNLGALGLVAALLQGMGAGPLAKRFGEPALLRTGYALYAAGFLLLAFAAAPFVAIFAVTLLGIGAGLIGPSAQSLISQQAAGDERGAVLGFQQSASSLGRVIGPVLAGPMMHHYGLATPYVFAGLLCAGALVLAWASTRARA